VHGAKNSVLPILAATVLARGQSVIHNCPALSDVFAMAEILECLGCDVRYEAGSMTVDARDLFDHKIPDSLMQEMRSSVLLLGPLLVRSGEAVMCAPGGCALGERPIDLHIKGLTQMGAEIAEEGGTLSCTARKLTGCRILLDFPSVGATENAMLAAVGAAGVTVISNAAREPEIVDLQNFLCAMGANVCGAGTANVVIEGGAPLHGAEYTVMPDRIVAATYLSAVAAAGGKVELLGADYRAAAPVIAALLEAGCQIQSDDERVIIRRDAPLRAVGPIYTAPHPGFPTDAQPLLMAALCTAVGKTHFAETIFENRFSHVQDLSRMGADIALCGLRATVHGVSRLQGRELCAKDLRGGAALVVAALAAEGVSELYGVEHIDRGYERLEATMQLLGAEMTRMNLPQTLAAAPPADPSLERNWMQLPNEA
jgi:UDP-N-acetylglucosamine 1-carboxyvinyltransferase